MRASTERGFTIIEFIVASMFMGIVILAVNQLFVAVKEMNRTTNNYTIASSVGQQLIETFRNTPYSSITVGTTDVTSTVLANYPQLLAPRSVVETITQPSGSIKQVDVAISWTDPNGAKEVEMTTQISSIGINR